MERAAVRGLVGGLDAAADARAGVALDRAAVRAAQRLQPDERRRNRDRGGGRGRGLWGARLGGGQQLRDRVTGRAGGGVELGQALQQAQVGQAAGRGRVALPGLPGKDGAACDADRLSDLGAGQSGCLAQPQPLLRGWHRLAQSGLFEQRLNAHFLIHEKSVSPLT